MRPSGSARTTSVKVPPTSTPMRAGRFGFPFPDVIVPPYPFRTYRKINDAAPAECFGAVGYVRLLQSMSAFGTKRTSRPAQSMSTFGGKEDMPQKCDVRF